MARPLIELKGIGKSYGKLRVIDGIDLDIPRHSVVSLIGASGSGKSTLLRCLNGLEDIQQGQIRFDGEVISGLGIDHVALRRRIGMVFQSYNLFPHMSVLDNCIVAPVTTHSCSRTEAEARALTMLERVGMRDKAKAFPDQLSGGQQQRVAIARTMIMQPEALLLDEITSALDPELVMEVLDLVRDLAMQGMTMLLTTHEMNFAREISDKVCFLHAGRILEEGPPEQVFGSPREAATRSFLRRVTAAGRL
ncbi:ATP-binding cassette domain-containing protein [Rhizobium lusitanum]|uniref:ATP-binding cassette domain-containing protein n=1 Tax=Rhizobium lusitanum TaxID=293958 RepID=A0A6L9UIR6_9HYPH|nr:amino acid ABC transporter ATP-binding protein [Rhizobium lusitanum]NEI73996.1 ATP-binding cassette domain-containing protein [Rhizobium lusitanum]